MNERAATTWSRTRVISYLLGGLVHPGRMKGDYTELFRAAKRRATRIESKPLLDIFSGIDRCEIRLQYSPLLGGGTIADVAALAQVAKFLDRRHIFEIGTFRGH